MSNEDVAEDVSQVTDFHFHTCRKFRLFSSKSDGYSQNEINIRNRVATSSQLGVTFVTVNSNQLSCFHTKSLLGYKITRENMNVEVTDLPIKTIRLHGVVLINDMGVNSDGTVLGVLHTKNNDVSVDVFDIKKICTSSSIEPFKPLCTTRVGTEQINQGSCLEWNPAFPDTFAASSTDRSILVAKINVQSPANQKLVGIGKFGAVTTAISWSPKGKQLTIGDSLGKIVQLKPELEVVRSQHGPENKPNYGRITGLCWLATTEWLVSLENGTDQDAYLMRCKKDKPTEWIQFHELSYSSSKWPLPPQLFPATQLLVDWNVVIVGNSKTSEISTVGKRDDWQTWVPVEGESIYLPTTSSGKDTVPIGVAVDRSMTDEVLLNPDGSQRHRPSPLVLCLTNDGILTAHHIISTFAAHIPCQMSSQNLAINDLKKLQFDSQKPISAPPSDQTPVTKPSTVFGQKPEAETLKSSLVGSPSSVQTPKPSSSLFNPKSIASNIETSQLTESKPSTPAAPSSQPKIASTPKSEAIPKISDKTLEHKKAELIATKKQVLIERMDKINDSMAGAKDATMKLSFAVGKVKTTIMECADVVRASLGDSKEVMDELKNLILSIERMSDRTQHTVKEMDFEIDEKMELVAGVEDGNQVLEKLRNMSETEKLMRFNKLETAADLLNGKYEECSDLIKKLRMSLSEKESLRKQAILSPLRLSSNLNQLRSGSETELALKVMRNVSKIIMDTREQIQRTELEFVRFQRDVKFQNFKKGKENLNFTQPLEMSSLDGDAPQGKSLTDAESIKVRQALVNQIQKRGIVKTRNVIVESYKKSENSAAMKNDLLDTSNLSNAILKLSMTPRRVMPSSSLFSASPSTPSTKSDAATQADEPPIVKTVVVTVESPAKPIASAPAVSSPLIKLNTTTATTTMTTPKVTVPKEEANKTQDQKPIISTPASSSIFSSGSLFGTKTQTPLVSKEESTLTTGVPSLINSSLSISPQEIEKASSKVETLNKTEEVKDEKSENEVTPDLKSEEPKSLETKVKEEPKPAVQTPVKEEETGSNIQKTPSFSFNSTTTPKSTSSTSSIFGGGLKTQTPSSSNSTNIFGARTTTTATPTPASNTSSIFGGGSKAASSPFGSFGQAGCQPAKTSNPATSTASVTFSFNTGATSASAKPAGFGSFGAGASAKPSSVFGGSVTAPTVPNVDDGMEDDSMANGGGSGGFMSGLGNARTSNTSGGNNPFAPKTSTGTSASSSSWLFGGGGNQQQQQQQKVSFQESHCIVSIYFLFQPSFSFNTAGSSAQQASAPATGTSSVFGGAPKFGSQPAFGAKPFGGGANAGLSKNASIFGGATSSTTNNPATGGFAQFASGQKTSSLFGGGATPQTNTSIFGGGANTTPAPTSSVFGGGASANANKPTSFTSWR